MLTMAALPALASDHWDDWKVEDHEKITRSFTVGSGSNPRRLLVDNVDGFIHVTGTAGSEIKMSVDRHTKAESKEAMEEAKRDVKLDISQQGNFVRVYADGPFRNNNRGERYYNYRVKFDCEIQVPKDAEIVLHSLSSEINVKGTGGDFDVHTLNGPIDMESVAGSGSVHTLNGNVKVAFAKNPEKASTFHTLNGTVDIYFQKPLNASLKYHTLNGGVWADFDVQPETTSSGNGHLIYGPARSNRNGSARVGSGGPQLSFEGLNGAIRLHTKTE
jgi:hypothetical protein